jgi:hypothetical protein
VHIRGPCQGGRCAGVAGHCQRNRVDLPAGKRVVVADATAIVRGLAVPEVPRTCPGRCSRRGMVQEIVRVVAPTIWFSFCEPGGPPPWESVTWAGSRTKRRMGSGVGVAVGEALELPLGEALELPLGEAVGVGVGVGEGEDEDEGEGSAPPTGRLPTVPRRMGKTADAARGTVPPKMFEISGVTRANWQARLTCAREPSAYVFGEGSGKTGEGSGLGRTQSIAARRPPSAGNRPSGAQRRRPPPRPAD